MTWAPMRRIRADKTGGVDFQDWLELGIQNGYCSEPVCNTHDGLPSTEEEDQEWEEGYDPCVPAVRLLPGGDVASRWTEYRSGIRGTPLHLVKNHEVP